MERTSRFHRMLYIFSEISYCFKNCFTVIEKALLVLLALLVFAWQHLHAETHNLETILHDVVKTTSVSEYRDTAPTSEINHVSLKQYDFYPGTSSNRFRLPELESMS